MDASPEPLSLVVPTQASTAKLVGPSHLSANRGGQVDESLIPKGPWVEVMTHPSGGQKENA